MGCEKGNNNILFISIVMWEGIFGEGGGRGTTPFLFSSYCSMVVIIAYVQ